MKMFSKILATILVVACALGLPACCRKDKQPPPPKVAAPKAEVLPTP